MIAATVTVLAILGAIPLLQQYTASIDIPNKEVSEPLNYVGTTVEVKNVGLFDLKNLRSDCRVTVTLPNGAVPIRDLDMNNEPIALLKTGDSAEINCPAQIRGIGGANVDVTFIFEFSKWFGLGGRKCYSFKSGGMEGPRLRRVPNENCPNLELS